MQAGCRRRCIPRPVPGPTLVKSPDRTPIYISNKFPAQIRDGKEQMTPMKPIATIEGHRSKSERVRRDRAEKNLLTGTGMVEDPDTAADPVAHEKFMDTVDLFTKLGKADRVYSDVINRYAQLYSIWRSQKRVYADTGAGYADMMKTHDALFKIERENCMTLTAALRSIPQKSESPLSPLRAALED